MRLPTHVQEYIDSIGTVDYFSRRSPLPEGCKLYEMRVSAWAAAREAAWAAAQAGAWDAAGVAARAAAWNAAQAAARDAEWDAARDAAGEAARAAVRAAAGAATRAAARTAARAAAGDATMLALCLLMRDHIAPEHLAYALMRWAIWQAGYGVAAEVDGTHYCYRRP